MEGIFLVPPRQHLQPQHFNLAPKVTVSPFTRQTPGVMKQHANMNTSATCVTASIHTQHFDVKTIQGQSSQTRQNKDLVSKAWIPKTVFHPVQESLPNFKIQSKFNSFVLPTPVDAAMMLYLLDETFDRKDFIVDGFKNGFCCR